MNFWKIMCLCIVINSCSSSSKKETRDNVDELEDIKIENVSLLISRTGRAIPVGEIPEDSIIPDDFMDDLYLLELDSNGLLKTSHGFGKVAMIEGSDRKDLKLNFIESKDSVFLSEEKSNTVLVMAKHIYLNNEYWSERSPTDSWVVKLKINDKTSIYHDGEFLHTKALDESYLEIVDEMVRLSKMKVKDYR